MSEVLKSSLGVELRLNDEGRYEVWVDDELMVKTGVESMANSEFQEFRSRRLAPARAQLAAERARGDLRALQGEFFAGRAKLASKGGKGGRGGV